MGSEYNSYRLGDIAAFSYGKMPKKEKLGKGEYITYSGYKYLEPYPEMNASTGDVIVVARGVGGTGDVKLVERDCYLTNLSIKISLDNALILNEYFYYIFKLKNLRHLDSGSAQSQITIADLSNVILQVPSITEQRSVIRHLKTLDKKITLNRQINQTLEQMAQTLFKSWFVDFDPVIDNALDAGNPIPDELQHRALIRQALRKAVRQGQAAANKECEGFKPLPASLPKEVRQLFPDAFEESELGWVPKGWEVSFVGHISECFDKHRIPLSKKQREEKKPGIYPYHGATSVMDHISEFIFDDIYLLIGEDGSVIKENGTPFCQYIWGKCWVNNHAHVLKGRNGVTTEHLLTFMAQANIRAFVTGAVQMKINQRNMNSIPFLLANDRVNHQFSATILPLYAKLRANCDQILQLEKLRDTLLPKLISGELRLDDVEAAVEQETVSA